MERCPTDGAELRAVVDPQIGKTMGGRYRLISRLGSGGMSSVYLARHVLIDRLMAIKTLRRDLAQDAVQRDRFLREARAVNRINHANIVEITDFGESDDGLVYLVMEYVPGEPLLKVMGESGPFAAGRALHIAEQVGNALGRAHQMGVVHRDLKPENILVVQREDQADFVKVLDFGIAKIMDAPSLTGSQQIFGTPGYIAPEYIQSTQIDGRADLYSLGVILYEMVTGALPFDYEYPGDLLVKHVTEAPVEPRKRHPGVEPAMDRLIMRCLQKDPGERFRDAYHFLEELRSTRERLGPADSWGGMSRPGETQVSETPVMDEGDQVSLLRRTIPDLISPEAEAEPGGPQPAGVTVSERAPVGRADTMAYERGDDIPSAPRQDGLDVPVQVEIEVGKPPSEHPPRPTTMGLLGIKRWRARFDAIRHALDDIELQRPAPTDIAQAMAHASRTLEQLEQGVAECEGKQERIEELVDGARDFKATLGRAIDDLGRKLSQARGDFERVVSRRNELRSDREAALARVRAAEGAADEQDQGRADALLWELAALEEQLAREAQRCDALEAQLAELRTELEQENERVERQQSGLVSEVDREMARLEALAHALREPLEHAEQFVRSNWTPEASERETPSEPTAAG
ncbi:MAG: protein kinase domain-containing protein [Polyangiales bacterium]